MLYSVQGLQKLEIPEKGKEQSINGEVFTIKVLTAFSFSVGDLSAYSPYERQGLCKQVKIPVKVPFQPYRACLNPQILDQSAETFSLPLDPNLQVHDFEKLGH